MDFPFCVAQRKGFEPLYTFLHNTISNRARSTAPPSLQKAFLLYTIELKKSTLFTRYFIFFRNFAIISNQFNRLDKTTDDPLAKKFRYEIKSSGVDTKSIMAVCSKETPVKDGAKLNSIMTVPSAAGLNIALYVLQYFMKGGHNHEEHI